MLIPLFLFGLAADLTPATADLSHTHAVAPDERTAHIAAFEVTPVFANGLLYVITPFNQVIALNPGSGAERCRYDPHLPAGRYYSEAGWFISEPWTRA